MGARSDSLIMHFLLQLFVLLAGIATAGKIDCPCGWQLSDKPERYTNRIYQDFSQYPSATNLVSNSKVKKFTQQWVINGFLLPTDDPTNAHDQQFNADSVSITDGYLQLKQLAYSQADAEANNPVNIAGIQTKTLDILHGSFRTVLKITGATGGSCASFFWYHVCRPCFCVPSHLKAEIQSSRIVLLIYCLSRMTPQRSTSRSSPVATRSSTTR